MTLSRRQTLRRWVIWGVSLLLVTGAARQVEGQERLVYSTVIDSLSGSPAAFRTSVHRRLLDTGFSVREVAACDCLVATDPLLLGKDPTELRVHILRPPSVITVRVVVQAVIGPQSGPMRPARGEPPREVREIIERLREDILRARFPLGGRQQ